MVKVLETNLGGTKVQLKPQKHSNNYVTEALLICKWGGVLSHSGEVQARELGKTYRLLNPKYSKEENVELFSNNERRVKASAEAFAKGFLDCDVLPSGMVTEPSLFAISDFAKERIDQMKHRLKGLLHLDYVPSHFPGEWTRVGNPLKTLEEIYFSLDQIVHSLSDLLKQQGEKQKSMCSNETLEACYLRWMRLRDKFYDQEAKEFDTTKISDLYDCIVFYFPLNYPIHLSNTQTNFF